MKVFRTEKERDTRLAEAARWNREFGLNYRALDMATLKAEEPHLNHDSLIGGLHWTDPTTVVDPLGLSKAYVALFEKLGDHFESVPSWRKAIAEHELVYDAIRAHDGAAARDAMRRHLDKAHARFSASWRRANDS